MATKLSLHLNNFSKKFPDILSDYYRHAQMCSILMYAPKVSKTVQENFRNKHPLPIWVSNGSKKIRNTFVE